MRNMSVSNVMAFLTILVLVSGTIYSQPTKKSMMDLLGELEMEKGYRFETGKHCVNYLLDDGSVYAICQDIINDVPTASPDEMCKKIGKKLVCDFKEEENF